MAIVSNQFSGGSAFSRDFGVSGIETANVINNSKVMLANDTVANNAHIIPQYVIDLIESYTKAPTEQVRIYPTGTRINAKKFTS